MKRREFLAFMGRASLAAASGPGLLSSLAGCSTPSRRKGSALSFTPIAASSADDLLLAPEFRYEVLLSKDDPLGTGGKLRFGANADFNAFFPFDSANPHDGLLWTNHESPEPFLVVNSRERNPKYWKPKAQVLREMESVGGSFVRIRRNENGEWNADLNDERNRRYDANTRIPISAPRPIEGSRFAMGTLANCAGGKTPWGTLLTCEENYHLFFGEWVFDPLPGETHARKTPLHTFNSEEDLGWFPHFRRPPTHYGWVVEIHPFTGKAKKLTALGRFNHEGATCVQAPDGRTVVYLGDDANDQYLYKFIPSQTNSLEHGTLYAASLEKGSWLPLTMDAHPSFSARFRDQLDLLIQTRAAATIVGASPLDRTEDIERDPVTGDMIVALTNNKPKGRPYGSLLRISEENGNPLSLKFQWRTWIAGGPDVGISCPDNLAFDANRDLWITSDMSAKDMLAQKLPPFRNNGLYFVPMSGKDAGHIFQVASAPVTAEFTGPCFLPDGSLVLSVQHPGDVLARELPKNRTSHWPHGSGHDPVSAVVVIRRK